MEEVTVRFKCLTVIINLTGEWAVLYDHRPYGNSPPYRLTLNELEEILKEIKASREAVTKVKG